MKWVGYLQVFLTMIGWAAGLFGVVYAVNGATQAPAFVTVPVTLAAVPERGGAVHVQVEGVSVREGWLTGAVPSGAWTTVGGQPGPDSQLRLTAWGSTRMEQLLARGSWLVGGLGVMVGAFALAPVLGSIAEGRPFAPGNARRVVVLGATVAIAGWLAQLLPQVAGALVLRRTGLAGPAFVSAPSGALEPLLVGAVILAVAAAFRAGERMADELAGLV
ncbi:MAG TPA: hypothetical protein VGQ83_23385 [Polyangia bacterium]|jgi:hypothetical protein